MVMAQSLFMTLKHQNQDTIIDVLAPAWSAPILARMPEVNRIVEVDLKHGKLQFTERLQVGRSLRQQYDQAIILPRSFKSALIPYIAKIPKRTAYRGEMRYGIVNDIRELDTNITYKAVEKFVNLAATQTKAIKAPIIHHPKLKIDLKKRQQIAKKLNLNESSPAVGLMPGAEFGPSKRWPDQYFAELVKKFTKDGFKVYIFGSIKDYEIGEKIAHASDGGALNLCGKTTLEEVVDLISLVEVAITNDSGLMHIAAAVDRPIVAIYGAITPKYTPPLTNNAEIQYLNLDCSPCWQKQCPYGHYNCMHGIQVNAVYESAKKLLNRAQT